MTVGERIKELRTSLGLSQVDFADKINVSKQTLYKYENNIITNIPSDKIEAAAHIGKVSPAYLMGWEQIDPYCSGKEASDEVYQKLAKNILRFRGKQKDLNEIYLQLSNDNQERVLTYSKSLLSTQQLDNELLAAHARTDIEASPENQQRDLELMDDDSKWNE